MIKKLQALKAKKGFTLVELVVVIAIIGVLAAILIPTLIGVVQDANITSANSAANTLRTLATTFVTNASNLHKANLQSKEDNVDLVTCDVSGGKWTVTSSIAFGGTKVKWSGGTDKDFDFATYMNEEARDVKNAKVQIAIQKGAVIGLAVLMDPGEGDSIGIAADDWKNGYTSQFPTKAGVTENNQVIGTNPVLKTEKEGKAS